MLNFTKKLRIKELDVAPLIEKGRELFEILISQFAKKTLETIQRNAYKQYVTIESNLAFLKGKIQFREHLRRNLIVKNRFYTQYDEFSEDNLLNQALKYTTYLLANVCRDARNLKNLEHILSLLTEVSFREISIDDLEKIHLTRLNHEYEPLVNYCKLFISRSSVELSVGKISVFSFILDMNELFEEYIGQFIKREFSECYEVIRLQGPVNHFVNEKISNGNKKGNRFQLKPDIVLYKRREDETPQLLIDTKYKKLREMGGREPVDQRDLYQMYAYCRKYQCPTCVLLYPKWGAFLEIIDYHIDEDAQVRIRTVDLNRDLRAQRRELKQELASILECS
jgi:5-methylcytosine-specific restriction enzyme subunit McrC